MRFGTRNSAFYDPEKPVLALLKHGVRRAKTVSCGRGSGTACGRGGGWRTENPLTKPLRLEEKTSFLWLLKKMFAIFADYEKSVYLCRGKRMDEQETIPEL